MRISDWSSDVCSSDLDMTVLACERFAREVGAKKPATKPAPSTQFETSLVPAESESERSAESPATPPSTDTIRDEEADRALDETPVPEGAAVVSSVVIATRSEEHMSELKSLMRISYADLCLKKKNKTKKNTLYTK